jgi:hypothetical protein
VAQVEGTKFKPQYHKKKKKEVFILLSFIPSLTFSLNFLGGGEI